MKIKSSNQIDNQININKILTKCAKMTEEGGDFIRNGINNGASSVTTTTTTTIINNNSNSTSFHLTRNNNNQHQQQNNDHHEHGTGGGGTSTLLPYKITNNDVNDGGNNSCPGSSNKQNNVSTTGGGGRLQFFKDGKFILELARAREGDRTGWVSVPRKTYWPPTAQPPTTISTVNYHKNESSTSLSFSDDNSSIQSSPWQRDHCWKQSSPRRFISNEMNLYYYRPLTKQLTNETLKVAKQKRRRPYDTSTFLIKLLNKHIIENGTTDEKMNINDNENDVNVDDDDDIDDNKNKNSIDKIDNEDEKKTVDIKTVDDSKIDDSDCVDASSSSITVKNETITDDNDKSNVKKLDNDEKINKNKIIKVRPKLSLIIQKLIDELPAKITTTSLNSILQTTTQSSVGSNNILNYTTQQQQQQQSSLSTTTTTTSSLNRLDLQHHLQHVSPRKRILRELEKVSLDDTTIMKRSRPKINTTINNNNSNNMITTLTSNQMSIGNTTTTTTSSSTSSSLSSTSIPSMTAQQQINNNNCNNKLTNGGIDSRIPIIQQQPQSVSRPISSYSITSLLGHNSNNNNNNSNSNNISSSSSNNNNSSTSHNQIQQQQQKEQHLINSMADPSQLRAMLTSPKSPEYIQNKMIGYDKKRSPNHHHNNNNNNVNLSPKIISSISASTRYNNDRSPQSMIGQNHTTESPLYGITRSPGLSPSPEHLNHLQQQQQQQQHSHNHQQSGFHRFRHYSGQQHLPQSSSSSASSPNNYHPYNMSSSSSSRCSPSATTTGTLSPTTTTSDQYNNRFNRSGGYLLGSPNHHHQYQSNNTSPLYSRQSPQQQLYNSNSSSSSSSNNKQQQQHIINSPTHHLNNLNITVNKIRESSSPSLSPNSEYHHHHQQQQQQRIVEQQHGGSGSGTSGGGTRTVSKKTASQQRQQQQQQQYGSSPINPESYYNKTTTTGKTERTTPTTLSVGGSGGGGGGRRHSPDHNNKIKEMEYLLNSNNHNNLLAGLDIDQNLLIRPQMVPSLTQQTPPGMFFMHPSYQNTNIQSHNAYLPYYNQMQYASAATIAAYRNSMWMHYPVQTSRIPLMYPGVSLGPPGGVHHNLSATATTPWSQLTNTIGATDPVSLVRIKDEQSSDVPLNLSKH